MRHQFIYEGRPIYEWDQSLQDVNLYIEIPEGVKAKQLYVDLTTKHIRIGIKPNPPYVEKDLAGTIRVSESLWTVDGRELHIQLAKLQKGEPWASALDGHALDTPEQEEDKKRLLLERFQEEHAGFDFSGAEVSGEAPNPRTFLGGMNES